MLSSVAYIYIYVLEILTPLLWLQKQSMFINKRELLSIKICVNDYVFVELMCNISVLYFILII